MYRNMEKQRNIFADETRLLTDILSMSDSVSVNRVLLSRIQLEFLVPRCNCVK